MDTFTFLLFQLAVLLMSVVIHEVSHGAMALRLGDPTAKMLGRLTLNPIPHIDPVGSIALPLFLIFLNSITGGGIIFGWAKPVPYNPMYLRAKKWGPALVGAAGPGANLVIAAVFGLTLRFMPLGADALPIVQGLAQIFSIIVLLNILLAFFNLIPIPPLDGSKVLFTLLPPSMDHIKASLEQYGFILLLFVIFFAFQFLFPLVFWAFRLLTGLPIGGVL